MPTTKAHVRRAVSEKLEVPTLSILSSGASHNERIAYIRKHIQAMETCGRRGIAHAWVAGREIQYLRQRMPDLHGRAWDKFLKKHFGIGDRHARDIIRLHRAFPTLKSLPKGVDSIRGAIAHLRDEAETRDAVRHAVNSKGSEPKTADSSVEVEFYPPQVGLPSSSRIRAELRAIHQELQVIAATDRAAFSQIRDYIHKQHERAKRKTACKEGKARRS